MTAVLSFLSGKAGSLVLALLAGIAAGFFLSGGISDALQGKGYRTVAQQMAGAMVVNVQSAGRREMNYIRLAADVGAQTREVVTTLQAFNTMGEEAKRAANARAAKLLADLKASSEEGARLKKSLEGADATLTQWLAAGVPDPVVSMRYDTRKECQPDLFSAGGFPAPPGDKCPVAKPPR